MAVAGKRDAILTSYIKLLRCFVAEKRKASLRAVREGEGKISGRLFSAAQDAAWAQRLAQEKPS